MHVELCPSLFSVSIGHNVINHTVHTSSSSYSLLKIGGTQLKTVEGMTSKINKIYRPTVTNNWVSSKCLYSACVTQFLSSKCPRCAGSCLSCVRFLRWRHRRAGLGRTGLSIHRAGPSQYFNDLNGLGRIGLKFHRAGNFRPVQSTIKTDTANYGCDADADTGTS